MGSETPPYKGSLDPFEDIIDKLEELGVAYCLMVGQVDSVVTNVWCNAAHYSEIGIQNFDNAWTVEKEKQLGLLE